MLTKEILRFRRICQKIENLTIYGLSQRTVNYDVFVSIVNESIIRLHDAWSVRCRIIVLRSAEGGVRTRTGTVIPRSPVIGNNYPLDYLRNNWTQRRMDRLWEPKWYDPSVATRAARILNVANLNTIQNGLGASIYPEHLRIVRNVIAHSLPATWARFRQLELNLGITSGITPAELAITIDVNAGERYINIWINELTASLTAAIN